MMKQINFDRRTIFIGVAVGLGVFAASIIGGVIAQSGGSGEPDDVQSSDVPSSVRPVDCDKVGDLYVAPDRDGNLVNKCSTAFEADIPDPDTLPPPEEHGPYLIYEWGARVDQADLAPSVPYEGPAARYVTEDEARALDLFVEPSYLPDGYELTDIIGIANGDRATQVSLYYEGEGAPITVSHFRGQEGWKIYVQRGSDALGEIVKQTTVRGLPAIAVYSGSDARIKTGATLRVVDDEVELLVSGRTLTIDEARRILESLAR